jgi:hypothetical protein
MKKFAAIVCLVVLAAFAAGCFLGPARVNLERLGTIGFVGFSSGARGNISDYAGQVFLEILIRSQPRARIKELGPGDEILRDVRTGRISQTALEAVGRRYGVDAILIGTLEISEARPRISLASILLGSVRASVDVDARMSARLLDTRDGTTFWTDSARDRMDVANVSIFKGGNVLFDAQDPERAYGQLIRSLVLRTTRDFRR